MLQQLEAIEYHHTIYTGPKYTHLLNQRMTIGILYFNESRDALICYAICSQNDQFSRERGRQITSGRLQKYMESVGNVSEGIRSTPFEEVLYDDFDVRLANYNGKRTLVHILSKDRSEKTEKERRKAIYKFIKKNTEDGEFFEEYTPDLGFDLT